jgi:hypothetical protein
MVDFFTLDFGPGTAAAALTWKLARYSATDCSVCTSWVEKMDRWGWQLTWQRRERVWRRLATVAEGAGVKVKPTFVSLLSAALRRKRLLKLAQWRAWGEGPPILFV